MKILIVSQYFWPESFLINDLSRVLADMGHEITVLTGKPNYPDGKIFSGYRQSGCQTETMDDITIHRVPLRPRGKGGVKNLFLNYFSFIVSGIRFFPRFTHNKQYDVIFVFGLSPILSAIPAILLKKRSKAHLVLWVQDLWPESLSATGYIQNGFILKSIRTIVRWIYRKTDTILIQSKAFEGPIKKIINTNNIFYYPNSVLEPENYDFESNEKKLSEDLLDIFENNFCIIFAGNLGKGQSLDTIVATAKNLVQFPNIKIVLVGSGSMSDWLEEQKEEKNLNNLFLAGRYPSSIMPTIYNKADGLLVSLTDTPIFNYTVPSKVQGYLSTGKPIIASINGETARVLEESKSGIVCAAEDSVALSDAILALYSMTKSERSKMGDNGVQYFEKNFEMKGQAEVLMKLLQSRIEKSGK